MNKRGRDGAAPADRSGLHKDHMRRMLERGEHPVLASIRSADALIAETLGRAGFDCLLIDMQHGPADQADLYRILWALSGTQATPLVRVPSNDAAKIMAVLDAGAYGIVCPLINNRADAERFVRACRYPPEGTRSVGPVRAGAHAEEYVASANSVITTIAQIETAEAYANLEEIVATPGLDAVYPGPVDLSMAFGGPPRPSYDDPSAVARLRRIVDSAHAARLWVMLPGFGGADAMNAASAWGADWIATGSDVGWVAAAATEALRAARALEHEAAA